MKQGSFVQRIFNLQCYFRITQTALSVRINIYNWTLILHILNCELLQKIFRWFLHKFTEDFFRRFFVQNLKSCSLWCEGLFINTKWRVMVIILDDNQEIGQHVWSEMVILSAIGICFIRQLKNLFFRKKLAFVHNWATCSELPCNIITMV